MDLRSKITVHLYLPLPMIYARCARYDVFPFRISMQSGTCDPVSSSLSTQLLSPCIPHTIQPRVRCKCAELSNTLNVRLKLRLLMCPIYACHLEISKSRISTSNGRLFSTAKSRLFKEPEKIHFDPDDDQAPQEY